MTQPLPAEPIYWSVVADHGWSPADLSPPDNVWDFLTRHKHNQAAGFVPDVDR